MSPEQKGPDPKTPQTGHSGRESVFDRRLREFRNTGSLAKPQRKSLQFLRNSSEFDIPSTDSRLPQQQSTSIDEVTEIERVAFYDESSGLLNARTIMGKIATEMRRSARYKHNFSVLVIELDGFANSETSAMTPLANEMIFASFCKIVNKNIREVDQLGRFDNSSLLLVLPETNMNEAVVEAERLRHTIAGTHFKQVGHHNAMTISTGIATFPEHGNAPVDMLGAAMEAAQAAVAAGGNTVCTAKIAGAKGTEKAVVSEEDFSPSSISKLTEELSLVDKFLEDMSPEGAKQSTTEVVFPTVDTATIIK